MSGGFGAGGLVVGGDGGLVVGGDGGRVVVVVDVGVLDGGVDDDVVVDVVVVVGSSAPASATPTRVSAKAKTTINRSVSRAREFRLEFISSPRP